MIDIEEIYKEYFKTVYKYLCCLTQNAEKAEELTQEAFCEAIRQIDNFKGKCKIEVWICQIAKNLWYDEVKRNKKKATIEEIEKLEDKAFDLENKIILEEEKMYLYKKIHNLDSITKEIIILRINGELSFKEIGTIFNKSENWARVNFYRGKKKLKEGVDLDGKL